MFFCLFSKLSGSYNAALIARNMVLEAFPDFQIAVIDSAYISALQGLLLLEMARVQKAGIFYEEAWKRQKGLKAPDGYSLPWRVWSICKKEVELAMCRRLPQLHLRSSK